MDQAPTSPRPEQVEVLKQSHVVQFDQKHFGEMDIPPHILSDCAKRGDSWIPGEIVEWWKKICTKTKVEPKRKKMLQSIEYHLIEVARNAFEYVGAAEIKVIFEPGRVICVVADQGKGFDEEQIRDIMAMGHALAQLKKWADEFVIETNGKKYSKIKNKRGLVATDDTEIGQGSKITFIKNFE